MRACHSLSVNADLFVTPAGYPAPVDEIGDLDSTLIIYISGDNGASLEGTADRIVQRAHHAQRTPARPQPADSALPRHSWHQRFLLMLPGSPGHWTTTPGPRAETPGHTHVANWRRLSRKVSECPWRFDRSRGR